MKKLVLIFILFVLLLIAGIYIFIPSTLTVSEPAVIKSTEKAATRFLSDSASWSEWRTKNSTPFTYQPVQQSFNPVAVYILTGKDTIASSISIVPVQTNSIVVVWQCQLPSGGNPLQKLAAYRHASAIKEDMEETMNNFRLFIENTENVYKMDIRNEKVKDTLLMTTKYVGAGQPGIAEIYALIGKLKTYIASQGAQETNHPMLHVRPLNDKQFETMVAIPVDKVLHGNNDIFLRRMVPGNILVTEVKGGIHTIEEGMKTLQVYLDDYQKSSPAIPFESLITDRSKERDTSKWVTRLYYPVM